MDEQDNKARTGWWTPTKLIVILALAFVMARQVDEGLKPGICGYSLFEELTHYEYIDRPYPQHANYTGAQIKQDRPDELKHLRRQRANLLSDSVFIREIRSVLWSPRPVYTAKLEPAG